MKKSNELFIDDMKYQWGSDVSDAELVALTRSHGGKPSPGWWDQIRPYSLGWVTARFDNGELVGFVNVAWDGGDHAFILDTKTRGDLQRRGIATKLVQIAAINAQGAGCEWLHVDFDDIDRLGPFYFDACGFRKTNAGLIHLSRF